MSEVTRMQVEVLWTIGLLLQLFVAVELSLLLVRRRRVRRRAVRRRALLRAAGLPYAEPLIQEVGR